MARVLWIGDAGVPTGFGTVAEEIGGRLAARGHDVSALAVQYQAKDPYEGPLHLYRAEAGAARHPLGWDRVLEVYQAVRPDVIVAVEDPPHLLKRLTNNPWDPNGILLKARPIIAYLPIDGENLPSIWGNLLEYVNVIAMSEFGRSQWQELDFERGSRVPVISHGVDTKVWHPITEGPIQTSAGLLRTKAECREAFSIPQRSFVVGRVDTNSGRKDWGSWLRTIGAFSSIRERGAMDPGYVPLLAVAHTKKNDPQSGLDLEAAMSRFEWQCLITDSEDWPVNDVVALVNTFDVFLSNTRGEGWGLNLANASACGIPVLANRAGSVQEIVGPGGEVVDGIGWMTNPYGVDLTLSDTVALAERLAFLERNPEQLESYGRLGLEHVRRSFSWDTATERFDEIITAFAEEESRAARPEALISS